MRFIGKGEIKNSVIIALLVMSWLYTLGLQAQKGGLILEMNSGLSFYQGDLSINNIGSFKDADAVWGTAIVYPFSNKWSVHLNAHKGYISHADSLYTKDAFRLQRKFYFRTNFTDAALQIRWIPFYQHRLKTFIGSGFGMAFFKPQPFLLDNEHIDLTDFIKADLRADIPEKTFFIPLEAGTLVALTEKLDLSLTFQYNFTFTDFIDGVSHAGNPRDNDRYGQLSLGCRFRFFTKTDVDKDGIADDLDDCPYKPGTAATNGCPDADGDGIKDSEDRCVYAAGEKAMGGCPDTDHDGTADPYDRCPTKAGPPEVLGCPTEDSDHDGIDDHLDVCPLMAGPPERKGCPAIDSDLDGLLDEEDQCPYVFGLTLFDGCPDTDGDGIEDAKDACPMEFGLYEYTGCPFFKTLDDEMRILSQQKLQFRENDSEIINYALLDKLAEFIHLHPNCELSIRAYSDPLGSDENPNYISQLRAEKVLLYLQSKGVNPSNLLTQYFGAQNPLSLKPGLLNQAKNRRVEFVFRFF